jgi:dTDP-4-dehydrorhamnose 3,5-epimerase
MGSPEQRKLQFHELSVSGAYLVKSESATDARGSFSRRFCSSEFSEAGIDFAIEQSSTSCNYLKHTLRGMHYQTHPHAEKKIVYCSRGSIFDVVVDLRRDSPTFRGWSGVPLSDKVSDMVFVPEGCAHGFLTLADNVMVDYLISETYSPASAGGVRWDDPAFGISWPKAPLVISDRDAGFGDFVA